MTCVALLCLLLVPAAGLQLSVVGGGSAVLVRSALDDRQQRHMFQYLRAGARGSFEEQTLENATLRGAATTAPHTRPAPLLVHKHPYTHNSNGPEPTKLFDWAYELAACVSRRLDDEHLARCLADAKFDSLVSLIYGEESSLPSHVDHQLPGYGAAVSLGAACDFIYG
eukprot:CAMPEP_0119294420 /NCGR_PEP_ID=MMETSP1329-20130426/47957_1 /TAXON_ID=114041 /ORGANISM="Genus nov. species nov., Strain RCC1024" /LENGTH=167 /DNA_ID=CAMNT_0007295311 /DNA_START=140 /DNA_END=639 /DNA_ORIENTATION=+